MEKQGLLEIIDAKKNEFLAFWEKICNIESPSVDKAGVDAVGECFAEYARAMGWQIEYHREKESGDAVCITMNPNAPEAAVVFSGHTDTVHPRGSFGNVPVRIEGDRIYGPGVCDCKGGLVASLMAMAALSEFGFEKRPVKLILQSDEEVSSLYSQKRTVKYMAECAKGCVAFLNTEPCKGGTLTIERKGIIRYVFEIEGIAHHSSICFEGASAVAEAAHKIIELEKWKDKDGITCNVGLIEGGTAANTVPGKCTLVADVRYANAQQLAEVEKRVAEIAQTVHIEGTKCTLSVKSQRVNMPRTQQNVILAEKVNAVFEKRGLSKMKFVASRGGSDAADISHYGIPVLDSFGVTGAYIHSPLEYANIPSLLHSAKMLAVIAADIE